MNFRNSVCVLAAVAALFSAQNVLAQAGTPAVTGGATGTAVAETGVAAGIQAGTVAAAAGGVTVVAVATVAGLIWVDVTQTTGTGTRVKRK